jgi:hypothetical protein
MPTSLRRFEDYEPSKDDERPVEEYALERAVVAQARRERRILDAFRRSRHGSPSSRRLSMT